MGKLGSVVTILGSSAAALVIAVSAFTVHEHPVYPQINPGEVKGAQTSLGDAPAPTFIPMPFPKIGVPVRIQIPAIKVDATMQTVGLTKAGDMDVPANIAHVGWYKLSARPGELGTAVLGGHLNGKQGQAGVFIALNAMKAGDTLLVTDDGGLTRTFKVQKVRDYNYDDHPKEVFNSGPGSHMNLITCTGSWDTEIQKFSKRRVVFTTLVE